MTTLVNICDESVHTRYQDDPLITDAVYRTKIYTKAIPDEKEIAQVYISKSENANRIGWIIPYLSMNSIEHDYADNKYFHKHVFEAYKLLEGTEIPEGSYILIVSQRLLDHHNIPNLGTLSLSFSKYGIYPYYATSTTYSNSLSPDFLNEMVVNFTFNFDSSKDYFRLLTHDLIQSEQNNYARFMLLYQVFELAMESVFYHKVNKYKEKKYSLTIVRKKVKDISSERKLISLLYQDAEISEYNYELSEKAKIIFGTYKEDKYYSDTHNADMLYDIRNSLVHSYHRFDLKSELVFFCDYLELEVFKVINYLYSNECIRKTLHDEHFEFTE